MIFDEQKTAVRLRLEFGHVALFRAQARDSANAILEAGARLQRPAVGRHRRLLPRLNEAIQARLAEDRADAADQIDREVSMGIREPAVPLRGQAPEAFRATDFTCLVVKGDETLRMQLGKVLTDADYGDAKGARQRAGRQRAARLKCVEEPAAVIRRHVRNRLRNSLLS